MLEGHQESGGSGSVGVWMSPGVVGSQGSCCSSHTNIIDSVTTSSDVEANVGGRGGLTVNVETSDSGGTEA